MRRALNKHHKNDIYIQYPEVMQFNVELYKKKFKIKKEDFKKLNDSDVNRFHLQEDYEKYNVVPGRKN